MNATVAPEARSQAAPGSVASIGPDDFDRNVWCVLGIPIDISDVPQAVVAVEGAVRDRRRLSFVTPNVNWLVRAAADPVTRRQIIDADLSLADGAPLVAIARLLGAPLKRRTAGADLFEALRRRPAFRGRRIRVFFFGGRDGSAEQAFARLKGERGGLEAAGWLNPGHGNIESMSGAEVIEAINSTESDFVVVALGAAKGQAWIDRNKKRLNAPVIAHLGAVVDFTSGAVSRAPRIVAALGLEWAWRIAAEPSLAARYWKDGLSLARLFATRVAPQMRLKFASSARPAEAVLESRPEGRVISVGGDAIAPHLAGVRAAFRKAAPGEAPVVLDLSKAGAIDGAFLGLVLMLEKHLARAGAALSVRGVSTHAERLFSANAMDYLTAGPGALAADEPARVAV